MQPQPTAQPLGQTGANMSNELPPLPEPHWRWQTDPADAYTADQMRAYAAAAVAAAADRIEALEAQAREQALRYLALDTQAEALMQRQEDDAALLRQAMEALSLALSDVDWRAGSPTQPVIHKAHAAIRARLESDRA